MFNLLSEEEDLKKSKGKSLTQKKMDSEKYERFVEILKGEREFEGNIDGPEDLRAVINAIKKIDSDLSSGGGKESALRKRLSQFSNKAKDVESIMNKKDSGSKLSDSEKKKIEDFADEVEDALFNDTYVKEFHPDSETKNWSNDVEGTVAIKYTTPKGKDYYGLVRPSSGIITWEGMGLGKSGATSDIRNIIKKDPDVNLKNRIEEYDTDSGKILRGTKNIKDLLATGRFAIKDDNASKDKIKEAFMNNGARVGSRDQLRGVEKAIKDINFWKTIKSLF